jgi:hypothetical protein
MNRHPTSARAVPTRVFAAFDAGDIAALDTLVSPDLIDNNLPPGAPSAIEGMKGMAAAMREGFTNPHHEILYQAETVDGWPLCNVAPSPSAPRETKDLIKAQDELEEYEAS